MGKIHTRVSEGAQLNLEQQAKSKDMKLYKYTQLVLSAVARKDISFLKGLLEAEKHE
jgi:hypothetical protein